MVAAVGDVELMGHQLVHPAACAVGAAYTMIDGRITIVAGAVGDAESGGERPMTGQQRQRGQRIGGPPHDPLEQVRNVLGDLHRQPQAGQIGEVPPGDVAEIDVGDLIPQPRSRPGYGFVLSPQVADRVPIS